MASQIAEKTGYKPPIPDAELVDTDGEPLESDWHRTETNLLIGSTEYHFGYREDCYCGGNMFIYFSEEQARNRDFRGPDYFFIKGNVSRKPMRKYWVLWHENWRFPDVIIELLSEKTAKEVLTTKKDVYEQTFKTAEYFCYDPDKEELLGWRLSNGRYHPIEPGKNGRLWSEQLELWLGPWKGEFRRFDMTWLRFFDAEGNIILDEGEAERMKAVEAQKHAEEVSKRAEEVSKRAEEVSKRAKRAEEELARFRELLAQQKADPNGDK